MVEEANSGLPWSGSEDEGKWMHTQEMIKCGDAGEKRASMLLRFLVWATRWRSKVLEGDNDLFSWPCLFEVRG